MEPLNSTLLRLEKHGVIREGAVPEAMQEIAASIDTSRLLVGITEIKALFGYRPDQKTVNGWRARGVLPAPDMTFGPAPVWYYETIRDWADRTGRRMTHAL